MTDPQKDEHIEELLSKLQGIFGKLSHSDEEEARQKVDGPVPSPVSAAPDKKPTPLGSPAEPSSPIPQDEPLTATMDPAEMPAPLDPASANPLSAAPSLFETTVPLADPEKTIVPTAVYYPPGKENEAKIVAQRLETMTPKFTKVAFRLRVGVFMPYDPKREWKDTIILKAAETNFQAVFVLMDRSLDDVRRKGIAAELEALNVYFQDVLSAAIEKKAFYIDVLLGLVFFFDSRRPGPKPDEPAP